MKTFFTRNTILHNIQKQFIKSNSYWIGSDKHNVKITIQMLNVKEEMFLLSSLINVSMCAREKETINFHY